MSRFKLAAAQYPIGEIESFVAYEAKMTHWVDEAARAGAQLLVFPEYGAMELTRIAGKEMARDLQKSIEAAQRHFWEADSFLAALAQQRGVYILGGSAPVRHGDGRYINTARLFAPSGAAATQEKLIMTRFEREKWRLSAGAGQCVVDTELGKIGIAICYDIEFPMIARALVEAGAEIILAPSCTDKPAGYHRVCVGARARALENQCYVVQAPTVGDALWSEAVDTNVGAAGVFGPPDLGFPDDGIVALGEMNKPLWLYADIDVAKLRDVRADGAVFNHAHWPEQARAVNAVRNVKL